MLPGMSRLALGPAVGMPNLSEVTEKDFDDLLGANSRPTVTRGSTQNSESTLTPSGYTGSEIPEPSAGGPGSTGESEPGSPPPAPPPPSSLPPTPSTLPLPPSSLPPPPSSLPPPPSSLPSPLPPLPLVLVPSPGAVPSSDEDAQSDDGSDDFGNDTFFPAPQSASKVTGPDRMIRDILNPSSRGHDSLLYRNLLQLAAAMQRQLRDAQTLARREQDAYDCFKRLRALLRAWRSSLKPLQLDTQLFRLLAFPNKRNARLSNHDMDALGPLKSTQGVLHELSSLFARMQDDHVSDLVNSLAQAMLQACGVGRERVAGGPRQADEVLRRFIHALGEILAELQQMMAQRPDPGRSHQGNGGGGPGGAGGSALALRA